MILSFFWQAAKINIKYQKYLKIHEISFYTSALMKNTYDNNYSLSSSTKMQNKHEVFFSFFLFVPWNT